MAEPKLNRLEAIRKRLAACKKDMTTFRDPWQAVTDVDYLLGRVKRLEKYIADRHWEHDR